LLLSAPALSAMPVTLGDAARFNALVLGDMNVQSSDVEGRLAVRGNLQMSDYSVGLMLDDSNGSRDDLIVGGNASISKTRIVHGNAVVGGTAVFGKDNAGYETVGFYSGADPGDPNGSLVEGQQPPVDFKSLADDLINRSSAWGRLESTGETLNEYGNLRFSGDDDLNIFDVDTKYFSAPDKSIIFDIPSSSLALVNVFGEAVELFNTGFFHTAFQQGSMQLPDNQPGTRHDGTFTNNILFNFVNATALDIHSVGVKGSILAPLASTSFYNGHIDGNFIVREFNVYGAKAGQINNYRFIGEQQTATSVNEPPVVLLLMGTLPLLLGFRSPISDARGL
jgi:choice-of-anchor A domain-containing protein